MKKLLLFLSLLCIKNHVYGSDNQSLLNQHPSHSRSSSIQSINTHRSIEEQTNPLSNLNNYQSEADSIDTTAHRFKKAPLETTGYTSINIPENNNLNREDHELLEKRTKQCKLCGIFSVGIGLIYLLISSIAK